MRSFNKNYFKLSSFTLIEIIVVLTILSILGILVTHALKPAETAKSYRDTKRAADIKNIEKALNAIMSLDPNFRISNYASSNVVYISLPDNSPTCSNWIGKLPPLPSGYEYRCSANPQNIDGTGWIPINFKDFVNISNLPVDPINQNNYFYSFTVSGDNFKITSPVEKSDNYLAKTDGGINDNLIEVGEIKNIKTPLCMAAYQGSVEISTLMSMFSAGDRPWTDNTVTDKWLFYNEFYDPEEHIIDITDPKNPFDIIRSVYPDYSNAWTPGQGVSGPKAVKDNYFFFHNRSRGKLEIYDISNPVKPKGPPLIASVTVPASWPDATFVEDNLVYIMSTNGSIRIIDVSTITNPVIVGSYETNTTTRAMIVKDKIIYLLTDGDINFRILDARNPSNITEISNLTLAGPGASHIQLEVYQNVAYAVVNISGYGKMYVIDVSNLYNPQIVRIIDTIYGPIDPGNALQAVEIFGQKRLYGGGGDPSTSTPIGLIQAFDISDPLNPQSLGVINVGINAPVRTLRIANCHIYISTRPEHAIRIYQIGTKY
jgi:competence protein ComGC